MDLSLKKRFYVPEPRPAEGDHCWRDGHEGVVHNALCVIVSHPLAQ